MATEKQLAANRANALKITGPGLPLDDLSPSGNAFRHGLSLPQHFDEHAAAQQTAIVRALVDGQNEERLSAANEMAIAQSQLVRIRAVRADLMKTFDLEMGNIA
jgi:hypothetical protein